MKKLILLSLFALIVGCDSSSSNDEFVITGTIKNVKSFGDRHTNYTVTFTDDRIITFWTDSNLVIEKNKELIIKLSKDSKVESINRVSQLTHELDFEHFKY